MKWLVCILFHIYLFSVTDCEILECLVENKNSWIKYFETQI